MKSNWLYELHKLDKLAFSLSEENYFKHQKIFEEIVSNSPKYFRRHFNYTCARDGALHFYLAEDTCNG